MKPRQAEVNIGLLGHVDHGKTSITKAISGKWTDTHSEELKRGISIRLGYADADITYCPKCSYYSNSKTCPKCGGPTEFKRKISLLDAPGHETLMTTVISASKIMDGVLLLIAANESCPQPQTAEHLMILEILGIKNIVIVQTKVDLVSKEQVLKHREQIKEFIKGTVAEGSPIIPVVANHGININYVLEAIEQRIPTPKRDLKSPAIMYISRSFDINKPGTKVPDMRGGVVGGSIVRGKIKKGDKLVISPGIDSPKGPKQIEVTVESLRCEEGEIKEAKPGGLIGISVGLDPSITKGDVLSGSVIGDKKAVPPVLTSFDFEYKKINRDLQIGRIKENEPLVLSINTATTIGFVQKAKNDKISVRLKKPVCAAKDTTIAVSRRVGQRWRLTGWGRIL